MRSVLRDDWAVQTEVVVEANLQRLGGQIRVFIGKRVMGSASVRRGSLASEIIVIVFDLGAPPRGKNVLNATTHHPAVAAHLASTVKRARIRQIGCVIV